MTIEYQPHDYFDAKAFKPAYGINVRIGSGDWMRVASGAKPLLFDTAEERDAEIERLDRAKE